MTEEQVERLVERRTDAADSALMKGRMTQAEYDLHMKALNRWADHAKELELSIAFQEAGME